MMLVKLNKQNGSVSLFVVIFAALLITIISVSFVRIMIKDQQRATATDLSQSAYDSAQAGVEDAKRALLRYQNICSTSTPVNCNTAKADIASSICNSAVRKLTDVNSTASDSEVKVQATSGEGGNSLDQAYTCTKIVLNTSDYLGALSTDESRVIPLNGISSFNTVQIEWFNSNDLKSLGNANINLGSSASLGLSSPWTNPSTTNKPPIFRTSLVQVNNSGGFTLDSLDKSSNVDSNSNTMFLYPVTGGTTSTKDIAAEVRQDPSAPIPTTCRSDISGGGYACTVRLTIPKDGYANTSLLRLTALYGKSNFRVTLFDNAGQLVKFDGVQPQIDSTGRANDLYRRVQTRVELADTNFPYPEAAVDMTGNFCKNFSITDNPVDYITACNP